MIVTKIEIPNVYTYNIWYMNGAFYKDTLSSQ